jgi:hypothetical protein
MFQKPLHPILLLPSSYKIVKRGYHPLCNIVAWQRPLLHRVKFGTAVFATSTTEASGREEKRREEKRREEKRREEKEVDLASKTETEGK